MILGMLAPSLLFFVQPKKAEAFVPDLLNAAWHAIKFIGDQPSNIANVTGTAAQLKAVAKEIIRAIAQAIARRVLQKMTTATINWINGGSFGNPLFVENEDSFFKDIVEYEVKNIVDTLGYDLRRFPFGREFALNTIYTYHRQFEDNAQYSLSKVLQDPILEKRFREDFSVGGWDGFLIHTQYPQNNPIGFNMIATEQLADQLTGVVRSEAEKVRDKLDQGQGFLSTETCTTNPTYNNVANQFRQPKWNNSDYERKNPYNPPDYKVVGVTVYNAYQKQWLDNLAREKAKWTKDNTCPNRPDGSSGFINTTPGSAIAHAAMQALDAPQKNALVAMTTGSLAAIFDALLARLMDKAGGLVGLATTTNPPLTEDNWDYEGNTLGTVNAYNTTAWNAQPDDVVILSVFKEEVAEGIRDTTTELALMDNTDLSNPGLSQVLSATWPQIRLLDMCTPGPDLGWRGRLEEERDRPGSTLTANSSQTDVAKARAAQDALNELKMAVSYFAEFMEDKMMFALPSSLTFIDNVAQIEDMQFTATQLVDKKRSKSQALGRLLGLQKSLNAFTTDPVPGSPEEDNLIKLRREYLSTKPLVSNSVSIEDTRTELSLAIDTFIKTNENLALCDTERRAAGWDGYQPWDSSAIDTSNPEYGLDDPAYFSEIALYCFGPINNGASHPYFTNTKPVSYPQLLLVNARKVGRDNVPSRPDKDIHVEISCGAFYQASPLDYKGSIPGFTGQLDIVNRSVGNPGGGGGQCTDTGNKYGGTLSSAIAAVIAANPTEANAQNLEDSSGVKANARIFLDLVAAYINSQGGGYNATADVLNGNNNPSTGDIIAIWKTGDSMMERYDAIAGNDTITVGQAAQTNFDAFIPFNCTASGGGNNCGCSTDTGTPTTPPTVPPNPNPTSGNPYITSVTPFTAQAGVTTLTITGTNFSTINKPANVASVRFYYGATGRATVDGTVNAAKTQITVVVPSEINTTNTTIKVYRDGTTESNAYQIQIGATSTGGGGGGTATVTSYNATGGWGGNLAYNSTSNNWLVVSGGVNGRIMGNNGTAVTPEFKINTSSVQSMSPKVAYAADINKYMVIWIEFPTSSGGTIYGRLINADGSFSGNVFTIFTDPAGGASFLSPSSILQYDTNNKKFAFVWEYRNPGVDSRLVTISQTGVVGTVVDVGTDTGTGSWSPILAINPTANEYCIAYTKGNGTTKATKKYNVSTGVLGAETLLTSSDLLVTGLAYNSTSNKYLIGWSGGGTNAVANGKILNSCNINDGGSVFTLNSAGRAPTIAYNSKLNQYATIVQNQNNAGNTYNILSSVGAKLKEGVAFGGGYGNFAPMIMANTTDGTFAATSSLEYGTTRFAPNLKP